MKFQTIFLVLFGTIAVFSVICFAKCPASKNNVDPRLADVGGTVKIWGTFPQNSAADRQFEAFNKAYGESFRVEYEFHDPKTFDSEIVEALASGKGPDILLLPDDLVLRHTDKIEVLPYASFAQRTFQDTFVEATEIYMRDSGVVAIPFVVDPMVMYWNRDIFNDASITSPPTNWAQFADMTQKVTRRNPRTQDIVLSMSSFGEFVNVKNAKEIIAMLFLQVGNSIVSMVDGKPIAVLASVRENKLVPDEDVVSVFRTFMEYSNPLKKIYTWSKALPNSRDAFIDGTLAVYFDYASAYNEIKSGNTHLNFAVAMVPQQVDTKTQITIAHVYGLSVLKSSKNKKTAFAAVTYLIEQEFIAGFSKAYSLPPIRRDLLAIKPSDTAMSVMYDSAIRAHTWLDPRPEKSNEAFKRAVEDVSSGRVQLANSIETLNSDLGALLKSY